MLSASDEQVLTRAKANRFLIARRGEQHLCDAYFEWCQQQREPYVYARIRRRNARVVLDMTPTGHSLTQEAQAAAELVLAQAEAYRACWIGPISCGNDCLPAERAEAIAAALYAIARRSLGIEIAVAV